MPLNIYKINAVENYIYIYTSYCDYCDIYSDNRDCVHIM
jgi:hypothetical protein